VPPTRAMRPKAHHMAWQACRGARHNGTFREPARARRSAGLRHQAKRQRSDWRNFAECPVMLKRARSGRFTPEGLCLCVVRYWLTAQRGGKRERLQGARARAVDPTRIKRGPCLPCRGWQYRAAAGQRVSCACPLSKAACVTP
jgi:hypothetical protein